MVSHAWTSALILAMLLGADGENGDPEATQDGMTLRFELFVIDTNASAAFYRDVLGFDVSAKSDDYATAKSGSVSIGLQGISGVNERHYFYPELTASRRGVGVEVVLEVSDIEATFNAVKTSGHPILSGLKARPWGATDFRIADPDGYYLRITSR